MITIEELIQDEQEAIAKYQNFLNQGFNVKSKFLIHVIKRIQEQERNHVKILNKARRKLR
jgi:hypothetical protein